MPNGPRPGRSAARAVDGGYARSRDTRARILDATIAEASAAGFHKTSVARIAARAGVAVGNLHYHFGSRGELVREVMDTLVRDLWERLHDADTHAGAGADFFERERASQLAYLGYLRANPAHVRLVDEIKLHEPDFYERGLAGAVARMTARIRAGIDEGTLRPMRESAIAAHAHFLLGARHFLEQMRERVDGLTDEEVVDAFIALIRDGLGRRGADA